MKTTEEMIAVMQAFANGKPIQRLKKDWKIWLDDEKPTWDWSIFDYRLTPERHLPTTWEEFCDTHPIKKGEAFIDMASDVVTYREEYERYANESKDLLPNTKTADAMLALCQLIQLRDCYNDGWQPIWKDGNQSKYCIVFVENEITIISGYSMSHVLTFKTEELLHEFKKNFKYLIEQAKPLL